MTWIVDLADHIAAEDGLSLTVTVNDRPDTPADIISLYSYPGLAAEHVSNQFAKYRRPRVQVQVRSTDHETGLTNIEAVYDVMNRLQNTYVAGRWYRSVQPLGDPAFLRRDANDNWIFYFDSQVDMEGAVTT